MLYSIVEFEDIYRRCFQNAFKMAMMMLHDADEAHDVVQEAFMKLWETDSVIENEAAYVIRCVRNSCLNRIAAINTRDRIKRRLPFDEIEVGDETPSGVDKLTNAVNTLLSSRERQVIGKVYSEGLSYKNTAQQLGVSVAMVNKCVVNALKKLRKYLKSE